MTIETRIVFDYDEYPTFIEKSGAKSKEEFILWLKKHFNISNNLTVVLGDEHSSVIIFMDEWEKE